MLHESDLTPFCHARERGYPDWFMVYRDRANMLWAWDPDYPRQLCPVILLDTE